MAHQEEAAVVGIDQMVEDGIAALEEERYDVAAEVFRRVIRRAPFRHDARDYLAFALDQQFSREEGRPASHRLNGILGSSSAAAATSSRSRPGKFRFPLRLAAVALAASVFVIAVVALAGRLDLRDWVQTLSRPKGDPVTARLTGEFQKAEDAVRQGEFVKARAILTGALEIANQLEPPDPQRVKDRIAEVYLAEAEKHYETRNYERLLTAAEEGLKHNASLAQLHYLAALCYERQGLQASSDNNVKEKNAAYKRAIDALEKAVAQDPQHVIALDLLAKCYGRANLPDKAIETWKQIVKVAPESREAKRARSFLKERRVEVE